jgi:hypothetical protein
MTEVIQYQEPEGSLSNTPIKQSGIPNSTNFLAAGGPRTDAGKRQSSRNALKAGIFSRATLLKGEPRSVFQSLLGGLWEALQPVGKLEELLVEKLATTSWRYRRFLKAENAEVRKTIEFPTPVAADLHLQENFGIITLPTPMISMIGDTDVFESRINMLSELMQQIKENGFDEQNDMRVLETIYSKKGDKNNQRTLKDELSKLYDTAFATEEERAREGYATAEECKKKILRAISAEIKKVRRDRLNRESIELKRKMVEEQRQSVPDCPGLDHLLRYESSLERSFDRTLAQLERQQRIRRGQPLPPQLDVKIS